MELSEKQTRANLSDAIAYLRERLAFTRVRNLSAKECLAINGAIDKLIIELPEMPHHNEFTAEELRYTHKDVKSIKNPELEKAVEQYDDDALRKIMNEKKRMFQP
jgi:hypothetical protein